MNVLTLSRNYPNDVLPHLGPWVEGLVKSTAQLCEQRVIAPVPYAPLLPGLPQRFSRFRRIPQHELRDGIEVWHPRFLTGPGYSLHSYEADLYFLGIERFVDQLRSEYPFDLIHAHFGYPDGVAAARLGQRYNIPVIITEHAIWHPWMDNYPRVRRQAVWAAQQCAFHLVGSRALRNSIVDFTSQPEKTRLIPIGTDIAVFTPASNGHTPNPNQLVYVGRFQHVKGVDILLRAMREVVNERPETHLVVIGGSFYTKGAGEEGQLRELVRELQLEKHISFVGVKSGHEIARILQESALLVLPSRRESFGTVLIEALACGTPVVATRCGGPEDIINDNVGALVPVEDEQALAEAIKTVQRQRDQFNATKLRDYVIGKYSWDVIASQVAELYGEAIDNFR